MSEAAANKTIDDITKRYREKTEKSATLHGEASIYMPGGHTRDAVNYKPYPAFIDHGRGCRIYDHDGHEYIDFLNNYTSLIHGHCDPDIIAAVQAQLQKGSSLCSPSALQIEHSKMLCGRTPFIEMVRYTNSGTEATMFAIRTARAVTQKDMIIKLEGAYHGTHDDAKVSMIPDFEPGDLPKPHLEGSGIAQSTLLDVVIAPFNNLDAAETLMKRHRDKLAGIIVEPYLASMGTIVPRPGYLKGLRELCDRYGVLLIFDEVQSFRVSVGGMQVLENVRPDISAVGKLIGGGYPVGAFGARRDIMERFSLDMLDPRAITHSGTFNGNEITMAAGIASMKKFDQKAVDHINGLGKRMMDGFTGVFKNLGLRCQATGIGSQCNINYTDKEISNALDFVMALVPCLELQKLLHIELLNQGIFAACRNEFVISTPMTEKDVDLCVRKVKESFELLMPYIREKTPHLL
ncbi:MAG TPA: aspartate aminotransferase family protein [Deltaproteobacteria bacterium]|nr:aspartate aminotransferase family protein [Deltaproteobacteria bacterium]